MLISQNSKEKPYSQMPNLSRGGGGCSDWLSLAYIFHTWNWSQLPWSCHKEGGENGCQGGHQNVFTEDIKIVFSSLSTWLGNGERTHYPSLSPHPFPTLPSACCNELPNSDVQTMSIMEGGEAAGVDHLNMLSTLCCRVELGQEGAQSGNSRAGG